MNEYIVITLVLHLIGMAIGLYLTRERKTPPRWTLGKPKDIELKGTCRTYWEPLS